MSANKSEISAKSTLSAKKRRYLYNSEGFRPTLTLLSCQPHDCFFNSWVFLVFFMIASSMFPVCLFTIILPVSRVFLVNFMFVSWMFLGVVLPFMENYFMFIYLNRRDSWGLCSKNSLPKWLRSRHRVGRTQGWFSWLGRKIVHEIFSGRTGTTFVNGKLLSEYVCLWGKFFEVHRVKCFFQYPHKPFRRAQELFCCPRGRFLFPHRYTSIVKGW